MSSIHSSDWYEHAIVCADHCVLRHLDSQQDEEWDPELDEDPTKNAPVPDAVGVPGAVTPSKMTGQRPSFAPDGPTPMRKSVPGTKDEEVDAGAILPGYGFQGLKVTEVRPPSSLLPPRAPAP